MSATEKIKVPTIPLKMEELSSAQIKNEAIWDGDVYDRQKMASRFLETVRCQEYPLTFALNGVWGSGKTFFLRRLCGQYEAMQNRPAKEKCRAIYFNAWEDDNLDDAILALVGQLNESLREGVCKEFVKGFFESAVPLFKNVTKSVLTAGMSLWAKNNGVPDEESVLAEKAIEGVLSTDIRNSMKVLIDSYFDAAKSKREFKARLENLARIVYEKTGAPLLFVVDELDRCRPTFAIEVLEKIKHFFSVPHIVFVLGIDKAQLGKSIQSVYGSIDVDNYLHRFIDLEMHLQENSPSMFIDSLFERYPINDYLNARKERDKNSQYSCADIQDAFKILCKIFKLSLREIEKAFRLFLLSLPTIANRVEGVKLVLALMVVLKVKKPDDAKKISELNDDVKGLIDSIFVDVKLKSRESYRIYSIVGILYVLYRDLHHEVGRAERVNALLRYANSSSEGEADSKSISYLPEFIRCDQSSINEFLFCLRYCDNYVNSFAFSRDFMRFVMASIEFYDAN